MKSKPAKGYNGQSESTCAGKTNFDKPALHIMLSIAHAALR